MKTEKVIQQLSSPSNSKTKLLLRKTRKRFNPRIFIDRIIETTAITSLLLTGFSGVGAMGCWGLEIIEINVNPNIIISGWQHQKNICLGSMLVSFSAFSGSFLLKVGFKKGD